MDPPNALHRAIQQVVKKSIEGKHLSGIDYFDTHDVVMQVLLRGKDLSSKAIERPSIER